MNLAEISVKRPVFAWMLMSALIIFGAICFGRLGVSLLPDVEVPNVLVQVTWPGAAPEVMETEIVDQMEQALVNVSGIKNLNSTIYQGSANISLEFYPGRNADAALLEVQTNITRVRLPKEVDDPLIFKVNPSDQEIMWLGISSDTWSLLDLTVYAERYLRDKFQVLPGVGQLILSGFAERNLRVWVDHDKLAEYDLTILDVQNALRTQHIEQAAGLLENNQQEINVRLMGEGLTAKDVGQILIKQRGGQPIHNALIRIADVAVVQDGLNDVRSISKIAGVRGGGIGFRKQRGANSIEVADNIKKTLEEIRPSLPKDVKISVNYDESKFTKESVEETEFTLILSAILTALICWLFLGSLSSTFNVVMSIPTSILGSFIILYFLGFTLNLFTLLALSLAIGVVVDDAIMVLENIVRHFEMGKSRMQASIDGTKEITGPALASTLAVLAVFLPIALIQGSAVGQFLFQFGITIAAAVALSLVEAITLTPMRCSQFLSVKRTNPVTRGVDGLLKFLTDRYRSALPFCLQHRLPVLGAFLLAFAGSLYIAGKVPGEFSPSQDQGTLFVKYETPVGSSLAYSENRIAEAEKLVLALPETRTYFLAVGSFMDGNINNGIMFVDMKPKAERTRSQLEVMDALRPELDKISDLKSFLVDLSKGGPEGGLGFPITFSLQGPNLDVLKKESARLIGWMKDEKLATDLNTDFKEGQPELRVYIEREAASARGVTVQEISDTIAAAIGGVREGKFTNDDRRYDVRIRLLPEERERVEDLKKLTVRNIYGEIIPVKDVVRWEQVSSLQTIARRNRERSITVTGNPAPGVAENTAMGRIKEHAQQTLPQGYRLIPSQSAETNEKFGRDMMFALGLGILVAYMVLAAQFNSFAQPFLILLAMPFAISGAALGLFAFGQTWNLYSGIGMILLLGIVKKNSILLVEFTDKVRETDGVGADAALLKACPIRLRPVLMTSIATIAAAVPPALALGPGAESRIPMALTILCGSAVSMLSTLFIVPCAYSVLESAKDLFRRHILHKPAGPGLVQ
ncbi:MAG: efflux RND transporter permease subunit [Candidatus Methylacidiphilales bacterium]|nr:efflux RND transporter permease subunit [Candidatus Methylacidiphilales bacterium]